MTVNELLVKFREDYRTAQPEPVRDIQQGVPDNDFSALCGKALELEGRGYGIDKEIDLYRWEPLHVMAQRSTGGISSVGSFNGGAKSFPTVAVEYSDPEGTLARLHAAYPLPSPPPPPVSEHFGMIGIPFGFKAIVVNHQLQADDSGLEVWSCGGPGFGFADGAIVPINGKSYRKFIQGGENISHSALHLWLGPIAG